MPENGRRDLIRRLKVNESLILNFLDNFSNNINFHVNPSSVSRVVPSGQTEGQTDMTKLAVSFCNFANAPKKILSIPQFLHLHVLLRFFCITVGGSQQTSALTNQTVPNMRYSISPNHFPVFFLKPC